MLLPVFKPEIIDEITIGDDIIGKVAGINIKPIDFEDESDLKHFIKAIEKLKIDNYERLFIEGNENINKEKADYIQKVLNLTMDDGEYVRLQYLPFVIKEIIKNMKSNLQEKEILIISHDKEMTKEIIESISSDFSFITTTGCDQSEHEEIYKYILERTGLSLFYSSNVDRIVENYSIIINLIDNIKLDYSRIRKNCIIFDFSKNSSLSNRKRPPVINDFAFDINELEINNTEWISNRVDSGLYSSLCEKQKHKVRYLLSGKEYFSIKDYMEYFIRIKGKF